MTGDAISRFLIPPCIFKVFSAAELCASFRFPRFFFFFSGFCAELCQRERGDVHEPEALKQGATIGAALECAGGARTGSVAAENSDSGPTFAQKAGVHQKERPLQMFYFVWFACYQIRGVY